MLFGLLTLFKSLSLPPTPPPHHHDHTTTTPPPHLHHHTSTTSNTTTTPQPPQHHHNHTTTPHTTTTTTPPPPHHHHHHTTTTTHHHHQCTPSFKPTVPLLYPQCTPSVPSLHYCMQTRWSAAALRQIRMVLNNGTIYVRRAVVDKIKKIITMPYKYERVCHICQRPNVIHMSSHLAMVHRLSTTERSPYLQRAVLCPSAPITRPTLAKHMKHRIYPKQSRNSSTQRKSHGRNTNHSISSEAYENFRFGHKFSLMLVGPSMSGISYFVKQMLERDHIEYDDPRKQRRIHWFYGQYQDMLNDMRRNMGKDIYFKQGLPAFEPDLCDIYPRYNNIVVLDDLMSMAIDIPIISKLFTQGRHRNASIILLLQNALPKGKYNTSISRNAQYMVLFRCPADRRQIGIMADRIFDKNKPAFMEIYNDIISKPYSYVVVDKKVETPARRQVIADIFGNCVLKYNGRR